MGGRALRWLGVVPHLKDHLGMEDQEISRAGFELDEFYEDEAPEDEADYEPEDDYEEDCDEEL